MSTRRDSTSSGSGDEGGFGLGELMPVSLSSAFLALNHPAPRPPLLLVLPHSMAKAYTVTALAIPRTHPLLLRVVRPARAAGVCRCRRRAGGVHPPGGEPSVVGTSFVSCRGLSAVRGDGPGRGDGGVARYAVGGVENPQPAITGPDAVLRPTSPAGPLRLVVLGADGAGGTRPA